MAVIGTRHRSTQPRICIQRYWQGERIRIGTAKGGARELANFGIGECDYGPHEFRYVMRSELLRLLLKAVPSKVGQGRKLPLLLMMPVVHARMCFISLYLYFYRNATQCAHKRSACCTRQR